MKVENRRKEIINILIDEGSVTIKFLAEKLNVSKMTIHRDLNELSSDGVIRRIRNGATIKSSNYFESDFRYRTRESSNEKNRIAKRASEFIKHGMSVIIDDGSTSESLIPFLIEKSPLTVITNNHAILKELAGKKGIYLIALGGVYSEKFNGFFGIITEASIKGLRADIALISSSSIYDSDAFHHDQAVIEAKKSMMRSSEKSYLLVDHNKFGKTALHFFHALSEFDGVVTTSELSKEKISALIDNKVNLYLTE